MERHKDRVLQRFFLPQWLVVYCIVIKVSQGLAGRFFMFLVDYLFKACPEVVNPFH